jgi:hypothetical protein
VPEDVRAAGWDPGAAPKSPERPGHDAGMDHATVLASEDEIAIVVGRASDGTLEELGVPMPVQGVDGLSVEG